MRDRANPPGAYLARISRWDLVVVASRFLADFSGGLLAKFRSQTRTLDELSPLVCCDFLFVLRSGGGRTQLRSQPRRLLRMMKLIHTTSYRQPPDGRWLSCQSFQSSSRVSQVERVLNFILSVLSLKLERESLAAIIQVQLILSLRLTARLVHGQAKLWGGAID